MHYSTFARLRDVIFLGALFFLVKIAFERTISFINDHKKSIVHELDRTFIDQIYTAQRQLHYLQQNYAQNSEMENPITDIKERLTTIEEKYKTNSPGLMMLGPIGSAAIVTKEEKLRIKLLDAINDLNKILHILASREYEFQRIESINSALEDNKQLLHGITA